MGGIAAAVVAVVVAVVLVVFVGGSEPSDEDQIRAVAAKLQDAWNHDDLDTTRELHCRERQSVVEIDNAKKMPHRVITVKSVEVKGDKAEALVVNDFDPNDEYPPDEGTWDFVRESGRWKVC